MTDQKRTIAGLFGRILWIIIAFCLAALIALLVLLVLGSIAMGEELRNGYLPGGDAEQIVGFLSLLIGGGSFLLVVAPALGILPALLAIIVAEVARIRNILYYIVAGGLSLAVLPVLASSGEVSLDAHSLAIFATAGFSGGLAYWLMAGRNT